MKASCRTGMRIVRHTWGFGSNSVPLYLSVFARREVIILSSFFIFRFELYFQMIRLFVHLFFLVFSYFIVSWFLSFFGLRFLTFSS